MACTRLLAESIVSSWSLGPAKVTATRWTLPELAR